MSTARKHIEAVEQPATDGAMPEPKKPRRWRRRLIMFIVPLVLAAGGGYVWLTGGRYVTTDNAYVHQPLVSISADVAGRIVEVNVEQNQPIRAGEPLFRIDPEPYRIALDLARAALDQARQDVASLRSAYETAQARLTAAEAIAEVRARELERQSGLIGMGLSSSTTMDEATLADQAAKNEVSLAREGLRAAAAALGGDPKVETDNVPAVRAALARVESATLDLKNTAVVAPVAGIVSQTESLNPGQYISPGMMVASIAQSGVTWIEANLKETQLAGLKIGQPVEIRIDAYPDLVLTGRVESIGSTTGSQLSLIPAQNATGNWVKVVQRVPVRIEVLPADEAHPLRSGMSAHVSVDGGHTRLDALL